MPRKKGGKGVLGFCYWKTIKCVLVREIAKSMLSKPIVDCGDGCLKESVSTWGLFERR